MSAKMTTWTVQREGARIDVKAGALAVYVDDKLVQQQRCEQLKLVHVFGPVEISAKARGLMFRHQLEVMCFDRGGKYLGQLIGPERATAPRRLAQYKALLDAPTRLKLARVRSSMPSCTTSGSCSCASIEGRRTRRARARSRA